MSDVGPSSLFVSLYFDEDVSALLAKLVKARGFAALTTLEAGRVGRSDVDQLDFAASHGMAILTHNRADFEALSHTYVAEGKSHHGMIIAVRRSPYELARRLLRNLNQISTDEMRDQVLYM